MVNHSGTHVADGERDQRGHDVEPVGERVEQLAEAADLVEPAGQEPVDPVGGAADREHHDRPPVGVRAEQQVQEQRYAERAGRS